MKATRRNSGFSLVEVLCAILVLGIGLAGLTQAVSTALTSNKESELQTTAALFAAGIIEQLRADGFITDGVTEGDCGESLTLYRWKQSITPAGLEGLHDVTVLVENAKTGQAIYELRTLLFEAPMDYNTTGNGRPSDAGTRRRDRR